MLHYSVCPYCQIWVIPCTRRVILFSSPVYTLMGLEYALLFSAYGKIYTNCTTDYVTVKEPWCSLTYDTDRQSGFYDFERTCTILIDTFMFPTLNILTIQLVRDTNTITIMTNTSLYCMVVAWHVVVFLRLL